MNHRFVEKVQVFLHGLPVLDHRVHLLVVLSRACVAQILLHYKGRGWGLGDIVNPRAPPDLGVVI